MDLPSYGEVSRILKAEFDTGKLFWIKRSSDLFADGKQSAEHNCKAWNARWAGQEAFTATDRYGYRHGAMFAHCYLAHRVIWLLANREWPKDHIDHVNGVRADNSLRNLRAVTNAQNQKNRRVRRDNKSGVQGVSWCSRDGKWRAQIVFGGKNMHIGLFDDFNAASCARKAAEVLYGYHQNHGSKSALSHASTGATR